MRLAADRSIGKRWYSKTLSDRFRALCNKPLESCEIRKEAALRGSVCVPQVTRDLTLTAIRKWFYVLSGIGPEVASAAL